MLSSLINRYRINTNQSNRKEAITDSNDGQTKIWLLFSLMYNSLDQVSKKENTYKMPQYYTAVRLEHCLIIQLCP